MNKAQVLGSELGGGGGSRVDSTYLCRILPPVHGDCTLIGMAVMYSRANQSLLSSDYLSL